VQILWKEKKKSDNRSNLFVCFLFCTIEALKRQSFKFREAMKTIIPIFILITAFVFPQHIQGQLLSVSGYVKNQLTGQVIENAAIYESISGIGTITNGDGYYRLLLNRGKQNLKISGLGYKSFSAAFTMTSDTIISIELKPENMPSGKIVAGNSQSKDSVDKSESAVPEKKQKQ
jgi:hypothetical protein